MEKNMDNVLCNKEKKVYLDYNATTPLEEPVLTAINEALKEAWGNPSSSHSQGLKAKKMISEARTNVAHMIGGKAADLVFTSGGTEGNNWVFHTAVKFYHTTLKQNFDGSHEKLPHFVTSNLEHDSVKLALENMVAEGLADCTFVPASKTSGRVEVEDVVSAVQDNTVMVTVMLANNETGVIQPVEEICTAVKGLKRGRMETRRILLHTDAAQAVGKIPVDVQHLQVDYLTIVGHKFYGPRIGALYVQNLDSADTPLYPMFFGGGQERSYRSGTENTGMIAGLGKAAELVVENLEAYESHFRHIRDYLEEELKKNFADLVHINAKFENSQRLPNTCNFSFLGPGLEGHKVLQKAECLEASVGAACHEQSMVSPILVASGVNEQVARNALRLSVGRSTSKADIDVVIKDLQACVESLSKQVNCS